MNIGKPLKTVTKTTRPRQPKRIPCPEWPVQEPIPAPDIFQPAKQPAIRGE